MKREGTRGAYQKLAQRNSGGHGDPRPRIKNVIPVELREPVTRRYRHSVRRGLLALRDRIKGPGHG